MKIRFPRYSLLLAGALGLALAAPPLWAQPGNGQGKGQGAAAWKEDNAQRGQGRSHRESRGQGQGQGQRQMEERRQRDGQRDETRDRDRDRYYDGDRDGERYFDRERNRDRYRDETGRPLIDEREIRDIFRDRREIIRHDDRDSLPPGIRMNLERGKPLPPGIAKTFDERVRRDLPDYENYAWRRVGNDAVLVDLTNDIIREVIRDVVR